MVGKFVCHTSYKQAADMKIIIIGRNNKDFLVNGIWDFSRAGNYKENEKDQ